MRSNRLTYTSKYDIIVILFIKKINRNVSVFTRLYIMKNTLIYTHIINIKTQEIPMSTLFGSIFGGTSISALLLGAFNVPVESAPVTLMLSIAGGIAFTLVGYSIDKKNSLIE